MDKNIVNSNEEFVNYLKDLVVDTEVSLNSYKDILNKGNKDEE